MHELALTQEVISIACERAHGARIKRIVLEIGKLSAVLPDAVRFCFELCCEGTSAEGAALQIIEKSGLAQCKQCGAEVRLEKPYGQCTCGCTDLEWLSGEELRITEMEVI